jgi:AcrR family transcriptional regulator
MGTPYVTIFENNRKMTMPTAKIDKLSFERMAKLFSVALGEFSNHDYHSASYNRIIKNSGLSKGTLYYYFKSKEDVFLTLMDHSLGKAKAGIDHMPVAVTDAASYGKVNEKLLVKLLTFVHTKPALAKFLLKVFKESPQTSEHPAYKYFVQLKNWMATRVEQGKDLGWITSGLESGLLTDIIWDSLVNIVTYELCTPSVKSPEGDNQAATSDYYDLLVRICT